MNIITASVRTAPLLCFSFLLCACSEPSNGPTGPTVRDSAGIRIVENTSPAWSAEEGWQLGGTPSLDIGGSIGDPNHELYRVRGAAELSDGRIVIANAGTYELRFFSPDGEYLGKAGGHGEGPGELQHVTWMIKLRGDSLLVFDRLQMRLSVFDSQGQFRRSVTIRHTEELMFQPVGLFGDASVLSYATLITRQTGPYRNQDILFRHWSEGEGVDTLGIFPGTESFTRALENGPVMGGSPYFPRSSLYLVRGQNFYVATSDTYEIGVYSQAGDLVSLIRRDFTPLEVTAEAVAFERERAVSIRTPHPMRPQLEEYQDAKPIPATMPAYAAVKHDELDNLWVEEYRYPGDDVSRWTVFDPDGLMLGTIQMPPGFSLLYSGDGFVLGSWQDEFEVDHVRRYELIKP
jgi:hypothetical protein